MDPLTISAIVGGLGKVFGWFGAHKEEEARRAAFEKQKAAKMSLVGGILRGLGAPEGSGLANILNGVGGQYQASPGSSTLSQIGDLASAGANAIPDTHANAYSDDQSQMPAPLPTGQPKNQDTSGAAMGQSSTPVPWEEILQGIH